MKKYLISWCFWNKIEKRHRFGSAIVNENEYDFSSPLELEKFREAVIHYHTDNIETEFQIIAISEIPKPKR